MESEALSSYIRVITPAGLSKKLVVNFDEKSVGAAWYGE